MEQPSNSSQNTNSLILRTFLGLLLLIPGLCLCATIQALPALDTLQMSTTDYSLLSESEDVGMDNYDRLPDDRRFTEAANFTAELVALRFLVVAIVPLLVGLLVGLQGWIGRDLNRLLLTVVGVFISPVVLAVIVPAFLGQTWNFKTYEPSPLDPVPDNIALFSPDGAPNAVRLMDIFITVAIAAVIGGAAFIAVMRGRKSGTSPLQAGIGVWLIGGLLAVASVPQTFVLPYLMTNGGPGASTTTITLLLYQYGFTRFEFGYAATQISLMIVPLIGIGFLIWAVLTGFRLRLSFIPAPPTAGINNLFSLLTLPMIAVMGLPIVGLILWGVWVVNRSGGFSAGGDEIMLDKTFPNTVLAPWLIIWLVQLPIAYLVGFALGFLRPFGRIGSALLFLPFMLFAFLPTELLMLRWFEIVREQGKLDTPEAQIFPWIIGAFSLIVLKLFFDGASEQYQAARQAGKSVTDAFLYKVFLPSLPVTWGVGVFLSFLSTQSLLWSLIVMRSQDEHTTPIRLVLMRGAFATRYDMLLGGALMYAGLVALIFLPLFVLLQVLVLDRLAILGGRSAMPALAVATPLAPSVPVPVVPITPTTLIDQVVVTVPENEAAPPEINLDQQAP